MRKGIVRETLWGKGKKQEASDNWSVICEKRGGKRRPVGILSNCFQSFEAGRKSGKGSCSKFRPCKVERTRTVRGGGLSSKYNSKKERNGGKRSSC